MRDKRKKFVQLAEARVNRAIKNIQLIGNLANKNSYEYTKDDARKITKALQRELDAVRARFFGDTGGKGHPVQTGGIRMAGKWEFNKSDPSSVRVEVTQRDQFNNDDVDLTDALVREVIQNSSDAGVGNGNAVKVRFNLKELDSEEKSYLQTNISLLIPHLEACGINPNAWNKEKIRVLAVEDFCTRGLTGSFDELDKDNFDNFWRAVGSSEKGGQKGGRWGLGKLVYSSSSLIRTFFGLTIRAGDSQPSIMGQVVLENHKLEDTYYPPHGFWFAGRSDNTLQLQTPVQDKSEAANFQRIFGLTRTDEPGLSIMIPFLIEPITEASIISGVVRNYYFPILSGKLEVEVGDTSINADTFLDIAENAQTKGAPVPFVFIKQISDVLGPEPAFSIEAPVEDTESLSTLLSDEQIEDMKAHIFFRKTRTPPRARPTEAQRRI